jgi:hypothetical protein
MFQEKRSFFTEEPLRQKADTSATTLSLLAEYNISLSNEHLPNR